MAPNSALEFVVDLCVACLGTNRVRAAELAWIRLGTAVSNPNLIAIVAFSAVGLLVTAAMVLRFPNFGTMVEQLEQVP